MQFELSGRQLLIHAWALFLYLAYDIKGFTLHEDAYTTQEKFGIGK
jgi:hypothetical protein